MFSDPRIVKGPLRPLLSRVIPALRAPRVWQKYQQIGGSRLHQLTAELGGEMEKLLGRPVLIGMRYTPPFLEELFRKLDRFTLVPLYPHYSTTTYQSILDLLHNLTREGWVGDVEVVPPFFHDPDYLQLIEGEIWRVVSPEEAPQFHLLFSAHGLPVKLVKRERDPYPTQVEEQVSLLRKRVGGKFKSVELVYQSRFGPGEWLQPYLDQRLRELKGERVVVVPISFLLDNSETDLELKIEYRELAEEVGLQEYRVASCPNHRAAPLLAKLVREVEGRREREKGDRLERWREGDPYRGEPLCPPFKRV
jgi:ferrochelatase